MTVAFRSILGAAGREEAPAGAGPDGTQNYVEVVIQSSQVGSALTDYPVYVDLSDLPAAFFSGVQSDGGDIRVTESDGTTRAPVELVSIDTGSSVGELHFLASSVSASSNTTYRIYYNASSTLSQPSLTGTYGRNAVWADYQHVLHMEEDPSGPLRDATGNDTPSWGTGQGATTTGQLGSAWQFDGTDDHVELLDVDPTNLTVSAWVKPDTAGPETIIAKYGDSSFENTVLLDGNNGSGNWRVGHYFGDGSDFQGAISASSISAGVTYHVAGTWDGTTTRLLVDGASVATNTGFTGALKSTSSKYRVGARGAGTGGYTAHFDGMIDEVRIRHAALSQDWMSAEYTNQNDPATFYTVGSQQAA